jgi:hypothetical protein
MYALQGTALEWAVLRDGFLSFRRFYDRPRSLEASFALQADDIREKRKTAFDREIPHEYFPFGALQATDLPNLLAAAKTKIFVIDPIDGDWEKMNPQKARAILPAKVQRVEQVPDLPF